MARAFEGKVALITGGSSGIGLATARAFAREGSHVVITGRKQQSLDQAVAGIGHGAMGVRSDAGDVQDIARLVDTVGTRFGKIDVLFANAGVGVFLPISAVTEADWDECLAINLKGAYFLVQKALPLLLPGAAVIFNSSVGATKVSGGSTLYSTAKSGLRTLGRALATELAPRGIRVNIVSPGPIDTPLPHHTKGISDVAQFVTAVSAATALKRLGTPEEIAAAVLFLASEAASFVVGAELVVDGGFLCM